MRFNDAAKAAEALGVDSVWTWDHFYPLYGDPDARHFECVPALLAASAADTERTVCSSGALVTCSIFPATRSCSPT